MVIIAIVRNDVSEKDVELEIKKANEGLDNWSMEYYSLTRIFEISYPALVSLQEIEIRLSSCKGLATFFEFNHSS